MLSNAESESLCSPLLTGVCEIAVSTQLLRLYLPVKREQRHEFEQRSFEVIGVDRNTALTALNQSTAAPADGDEQTVERRQSGVSTPRSSKGSLYKLVTLFTLH